MNPSWMMVCLQTLQCFAFLKVFTRNVWEWRASNSSGCSQENNNKRQKRRNVSLKKNVTSFTESRWRESLSGIFMARRSFKTQMKSFYKLDNTESIKSNCKSYINPYIHLRSNPSSRGKSLQLSYLCLKTLLQSPLKSSQEVKLWGFKLSEANKKRKHCLISCFSFFQPPPTPFSSPHLTCHLFALLCRCVTQLWRNFISQAC